MKSSLSGKRVKTDPAFRKTMQYARLLGKASKIASQVYSTYPKATRQFAEYRSLTGKAMQLLKDGLTEAAVLNILMPVKKAERKRHKATYRSPKAQSRVYKAERLRQRSEELFNPAENRMVIEEKDIAAFPDSS
jgi:hypothetical protein